MVFAGYKEIKDIVSLLLFWSFIFITFITIHNKMSKNNLTVTLIIKGTFSSKVMKTERYQAVVKKPKYLEVFSLSVIKV